MLILAMILRQIEGGRAVPLTPRVLRFTVNKKERENALHCSLENEIMDNV